jgi:hypothetical protein
MRCQEEEEERWQRQRQDGIEDEVNEWKLQDEEIIFYHSTTVLHISIPTAQSGTADESKTSKRDSFESLREAIDLTGVPNPIFCDWSDKGEFGCAVGLWPTSKCQGFRLGVPPEAVDEKVSIYMSMCTDIPLIHRILHMENIYIASPLVELYADANFKLPVWFQIPHCLNLPEEQKHIRVLRIFRDDQNKVKIQRIKEPKPGDHMNWKDSLEDVEVFDQGTVVVHEDHVFVDTSLFSAYVVVVGGTLPLDLYVTGCGNNDVDENNIQQGHVTICVWDKRLKMDAFRPVGMIAV